MAPRVRSKKNWIKGAVKRPGAFTRKAKAHGMSVSGYAKKVSARCKGKSYKRMTTMQKRTCRQAN